MPAVYSNQMPKSKATLELQDKKHSIIWGVQLSSISNFNIKNNALSLSNKLSSTYYYYFLEQYFMRVLLSTHPDSLT